MNDSRLRRGSAWSAMTVQKKSACLPCEQDHRREELIGRSTDQEAEKA